MYLNLENSPRLFSLFFKQCHCCGRQHTQLGITYYSHVKYSLQNFRWIQNHSGSGDRSRGTWSSGIKLWTAREIVIAEHCMTQHCQEFQRQQLRGGLQKGLRVLQPHCFPHEALPWFRQELSLPLSSNHFLQHPQMSCNSSRFISWGFFTSNASHSTPGHLDSTWVYWVSSDHPGSFIIFLPLFLPSWLSLAEMQIC